MRNVTIRGQRHLIVKACDGSRMSSDTQRVISRSSLPKHQGNWHVVYVVRYAAQHFLMIRSNRHGL
ncbi:hypothetical protein THER5_1901 [Bifidobacterium thermacidophilum subsp. thermacidophilum]|uniref:Uncharacterized protein n=1 Tax=Bifidobacterium thermacidophilum subsp. thermacidophilum TaxID=79262 RepID=A0A087E283_9BIFI|nr:hypothetical protein THER5_1901 [Bifidobacterium thermacidophilum subsp. thermacidophilum]